MSSPDFLTMLQAVREEKILIPAVHRALFNPDFKGFDVEVEAWSPRPYDGRFHPSSHSTWTVRQLYLYLVAPQFIEEEHMPLTGVLAVTAGKFWHRFLQLLWLDTGDLIQDEVPIWDPETNRVGHADGILRTGEGLEIKTINEFQINKVTDEAVLKQKKYQYWCQTQDYLDVLGLDAMRYFLMNPTHPFPMSEFVVKADKAYQKRRRAEYMRAIEMAQKYPSSVLLEDLQQVEVHACCTPKSPEAKRCPAKYGCPIGRVSL